MTGPDRRIMRATAQGIDRRRLSICGLRVGDRVEVCRHGRWMLATVTSPDGDSGQPGSVRLDDGRIRIDYEFELRPIASVLSDPPPYDPHTAGAGECGYCGLSYNRPIIKDHTKGGIFPGPSVTLTCPHCEYTYVRYHTD